MLIKARQVVQAACEAAAERWTHVHYDPLDRLVGGYRYEVCSCGARRVNEILPGIAIPVLPGWHELVAQGSGHRWASADDRAVKVIERQERMSNPWRSQR